MNPAITTINKIIVNVVGKLENIQKCFNTICRKLGLDETLGHYNKTNHLGYRKYYNDKTIELVANAFELDIKRFKYEF